jgi:hypothetical protein
MSPAFDYLSRVMPLAFQVGGKSTNHPWVSQPLEIMLEIYKHSLILFQACFKMKPIPSLVVVLFRARKKHENAIE